MGIRGYPPEIDVWSGRLDRGRNRLRALAITDQPRHRLSIEVDLEDCEGSKNL